jgi:hypothetical protein
LFEHQKTQKGTLRPKKEKYAQTVGQMHPLLRVVLHLTVSRKGAMQIHIYSIKNHRFRQLFKPLIAKNFIAFFCPFC